MTRSNVLVYLSITVSKYSFVACSQLASLHFALTLKIRIRAWRKKSSTVLVSFKIKIFGTKNLKKEINYYLIKYY